MGTDDRKVMGRLSTYGRKLGMAFQIRDDILGIWEREAIIGKPVGFDVQRRKKTLPVVFGLGKAKGGEAVELRTIYEKEELEALAAFLIKRDY